MSPWTSNRGKKIYDKKTSGAHYSIGDKVWLYSPAIPKGKFKKFYKPWTSPFEIINIFSEVTFHIKDIQKPRRKFLVHFDRLKPCEIAITNPTRNILANEEQESEDDELPYVNVPNQQDTTDGESSTSTAIRRSTGIINAPDRYGDFVSW